MLLIMGTIRLPAERLPEALIAMERMVRGSRAEDGCIAYAYAQDVFEPGLIHVSERWRDQAALDAHFASEHLLAWRAQGPSLGIGERNLAIYTVSDVRPL